MTRYQVVFSPELGLPPADFARAWNEDSDASSKAQAHLATDGAKGFDPTLAMAVDLLIALGVNITSSALYDLIKAIIVKKSAHKPPRHIHIREHKKPDGPSILVVDIDEG